MTNRFGEKLRALRRHHHLSQADLARLLGIISQSHVSYLETSSKEPSLALVVRVAEVFSVSTDYLLRNSILSTVPATSAINTTFATTPAPTLENLGLKLRHLRTYFGLTQSEVAQRLASITQAHISQLEASRKEPSIELLLHIADNFGVTTDYLVRDSILVNDVIWSEADSLEA
jgi:transcriptional regulator with XRE-family HTH domain